MEERYDDHCMLRAYGEDWRIIGLRPNVISVLRVSRYGGVMTAEIDISKVDLERYCSIAVEMINRRYRE